MNKKKFIWIGCISIGAITLFASCVFVANTMYRKQTIAYVDKVKSEYDTKLKDAHESIEKLKNEFAEVSNKEQESQQKAEDKNKEVTKESEKKENTTTKKTEANNNSNNKTKDNPPQESPELLKRSNFDSMNINFWATKLYYMSMVLAEGQSVARDMANDAPLPQSEVKKTISEYTQNLNENYARFKEVENSGIPSVCKTDYQKFKNLYSQYIKFYSSMYDEKAKNHINFSIYNKCDSICSEIADIRMKMESKLK